MSNTVLVVKLEFDKPLDEISKVESAKVDVELTK